jgi:hypothetical protein
MNHSAKRINVIMTNEESFSPVVTMHKLCRLHPCREGLMTDLRFCDEVLDELKKDPRNSISIIERLRRLT